MESTPTLIWTDTAGTKWNCHIGLAAARRLKQTQEIDLLDPKSVDILFGYDPLKRVEAIAELAREQWTEAGLTYEDFAELLVSGGETFIAASAALKAGLSDFFRRLGRADLAVVADRAWAAIVAENTLRMAKASGPKIGQILDAAIERAGSDIDNELDRVLATVTTAGEPSGTSPPSPGSTGDR